MVFGASEDVSGEPNTLAEDATIEYMQWVWATFARDPEKGLASVLGWPKYSPNGMCSFQLSSSIPLPFLRNLYYIALYHLLTWPSCGTAGRTLVRLGYNQDPSASFVMPSSFDEPCAALHGAVDGAQGAF